MSKLYPTLNKAVSELITHNTTSSATMSTLLQGNSFKLPQMPYDFGALEPAISGQIMEIHYAKHHNAYVTNLNATLEKIEKLDPSDISGLIELQGSLRFNGGGHINHTLFWENLAPNNTGTEPRPQGALDDAIKAHFGDFSKFKSLVNTKGASVQGSGWVWLGYNKSNKSLEVATTPNQDPLVLSGLVPLLGIDVWEHAYYLQYKNVRPDYLNAIWDVINWEKVSERLAKVQ